MPNLKDIRRRIGSVKNTQQITKAMKMVAASKLRRAQMAISGARSYSSKLGEMSEALIQDLVNPSPTAGSIEAQMKALSPLYRAIPEAEADKKPTLALVVIASDRGLCGAYNSNVLKMGLAKRAELSEKFDVKVLTVGRKAKEFFNRRKIEVEAYENVWAGRFDLKKSQLVSQDLMARFTSGEFDAVEFCYTEFRSAISQRALNKRLLPVEPDLSAIEHVAPAEENKPEVTSPAYVDGTKKRLLQSVLPEQVRITIYSILAECLASEFGARMTSMDNASRNAGDMINRLTLQANRVRQAAITTELMEIIGGAEALKG